MILQRVLDLVTLAHVRGLHPGVVACSAGAPRLCPGPLPGALGLSQPALVEGTVTPFVTDLQGLRAQPFSQLDHGLATRCIGHKGGTARLPCLAAPKLMSVQSLRPCSVSYFTELGLDFLRCLPQRGVQPLSWSLGMPHLSLVLSPGAVPAGLGSSLGVGLVPNALRASQSSTRGATPRLCECSRAIGDLEKSLGESGRARL